MKGGLDNQKESLFLNKTPKGFQPREFRFDVLKEFVKGETHEDEVGYVRFDFNRQAMEIFIKGVKIDSTITGDGLKVLKAAGGLIPSNNFSALTGKEISDTETSGTESTAHIEDLKGGLCFRTPWGKTNEFFQGKTDP